MLIIDLLRGKISLQDLRTSDRIHNAVIGFIAFGFIASGISAQLSDGSHSLLVLAAAFCGGVAGKCFAI